MPDLHTAGGGCSQVVVRPVRPRRAPVVIPVVIPVVVVTPPATESLAPVVGVVAMVVVPVS